MVNTSGFELDIRRFKSFLRYQIIRKGFMWNSISAKIKPEDDKRVLTFSPIYEVGHEMHYRLCRGQFVSGMSDVLYWMYVDILDPQIHD